MINEHKLVADFTTFDLHHGRVINSTPAIRSVAVRETLQRMHDLAKMHKVNVILRNQTSPEGDAGTFSLYREDWHKSIGFQSNIEQFRFPRSKKTRIRKKWAMKPVNWRRKRIGKGWAH